MDNTIVEELTTFRYDYGGNLRYLASLKSMPQLGMLGTTKDAYA